MYVETTISLQRGKVYQCHLIRESYRQKGKVFHRTLANISKLPTDVIEYLRATLPRKSRGENKPMNATEISIEASREYGASFALLSLARQIGLDQQIYSRKEKWREDALALIVGRVVYQGSKLGLTQRYKDTALWELCGHNCGEAPDVDRSAYEVMDRLLGRQEAIQRDLVRRRVQGEGCLVICGQSW